MRGLITSFITLQDIQKQAGICTETQFFICNLIFVVNIRKRVKININ